MPRQHHRSLSAQFPPSPPCECDICRAYCQRPGWWTVAEAAQAMQSGLAQRMMLEVAPDRSFGVLAPAFCGCEGFFALQEHARSGCTFLSNDRCALHGSGYQPLECRFCHHERVGLGQVCHARLEHDWRTPAGRSLVLRWSRQQGLWSLLQFYGLGKICD